ncbi:hypothetical protein B0H11DRAFT_1910232 [Mycena galericulata]|nr:hypothetical protein B0H11DRAFT_1910232 [Mycena galericulata]
MKSEAQAVLSAPSFDDPVSGSNKFSCWIGTQLQASKKHRDFGKVQSENSAEFEKGKKDRNVFVRTGLRDNAFQAPLSRAIRHPAVKPPNLDGVRSGERWSRDFGDGVPSRGLGAPHDAGHLLLMPRCLNGKTQSWLAKNSAANFPRIDALLCCVGRLTRARILGVRTLPDDSLSHHITNEETRTARVRPLKESRRQRYAYALTQPGGIVQFPKTESSSPGENLRRIESFKRGRTRANEMERRHRRSETVENPKPKASGCLVPKGMRRIGAAKDTCMGRSNPSTKFEGILGSIAWSFSVDKANKVPSSPPSSTADDEMIMRAMDVEELDIARLPDLGKRMSAREPASAPLVQTATVASHFIYGRAHATEASAHSDAPTDGGRGLDEQLTCKCAESRERAIMRWLVVRDASPSAQGVTRKIWCIWKRKIRPFKGVLSMPTSSREISRVAIRGSPSRPIRRSKGGLGGWTKAVISFELSTQTTAWVHTPRNVAAVHSVCSN